MRKRVRAATRLLFVGGCLAILLPLVSGCGGEKTNEEDTTAPAAAPAVVLTIDAERDWPCWRGPTLNNIAAADQELPLQWNEKQNVLWRTELPGRGHASPCVCGDFIFLPTGDEDEIEGSISVLCFDRNSGGQLWQTEVYRGELPEIHRNNSHASATAACDGQRVYFPYQTDAEVRMAALDLGGTIVWNETVATYTSVQGYSASPALYESTVIVPTDSKVDTPHKLTALDCKTGEVAWQVARPDNRESYASPLVAHVAGRDQLFMIGPDMTRAYDPSNGELLWECDGPTEYNAATVAFGEEMVYATGGHPGKALLGIRADGSGDVTETHLVFTSDRRAGYVPSPLLHDGLLYAVSDVGWMRCYDALSGDVVWEHDFDAPFYSSPVLAGERIYVFDQESRGYVLKAGRRFELLAENSLLYGVFATPVICGDRIYLRSLGDLYCLGTNGHAAE